MTRPLIVSIDPGGMNMGVAILDREKWLLDAFTIDWTMDNGLNNVVFHQYAPFFMEGFVRVMGPILPRVATVVIEQPYCNSPGRSDIGYRLWALTTMIHLVCLQHGVEVVYVAPSKVKRDFSIDTDYRQRKKAGMEWGLAIYGLMEQDNPGNRAAFQRLLALRKKDDACDAIMNLFWQYTMTPAKAPGETWQLFKQQSLAPSATPPRQPSQEGYDDDEALVCPAL